DLCQEVQNGDGSGNGKLTLTSISFNSMGSTRGDLSMYEFGYAGVTQPGINPNYWSYAFDGWGVYKKITGADFDLNEHFPYTEQFNQGWSPGYTADYAQGKT